MKKPAPLVQLLEDLQGEAIASDVETVKTSKAVVYLNDEAATNEDGIELTAKECVLVFANTSTVERLVDALESSDASLSLFDLTLNGRVIEELERSFTTVDEG